MTAVLVIIAFIVGTLVGALIDIWLSTKSMVGGLSINETDPSQDLLTIRFDKDLNSFKDKRYVTFKIVKK